jgi:hypothetical protein
VIEITITKLFPTENKGQWDTRIPKQAVKIVTMVTDDCAETRIIGGAQNGRKFFCGTPEAQHELAVRVAKG